MKKVLIYCLITLLAFLPLVACTPSKTPKIGVSFGVGPAARWEKEERYMKNYAASAGAEIQTRRRVSETAAVQKQDCIELIDSGIDVLIIIPFDVEDTETIDAILKYANAKQVKVVSYARMIVDPRIDLFVGYDSLRIGGQMGTYLAEYVRGNYFIMKGPSSDNNANLLYNGAQKALARYTNSELSEKEKIHFAANFEVPGWSVEQAEILFQAELDKFDGQVDAVVAPNDKLAGAAINVLSRNGYGTTEKKMPYVTGMDAELEAAKRIAAGKQSMSVFMNFKTLAEKAIEVACRFAKNETVTSNDKYDSGSGSYVDAYMINGEVVTKNNLNQMLIETGTYTHEQVYGKRA